VILVQDHADDDKHGTKSDGILVVTGVQRMSKQILMSPQIPAQDVDPDKPRVSWEADCSALSVRHGWN
jgi:hypothetical protein